MVGVAFTRERGIYCEVNARINMLKFYKQTKIYVHCPSGMVTGGAELLHQLVSFLREHGRDAYIVYFGEKEHLVPSDYSKYTVALAESVEDSEQNIEVFYEGIFDVITRYKNTQKFLWWISVDNFFDCAQAYLNPIDLYKFNPKLGWYWLLKRIKLSIKGRKNNFKGLLSIQQLVDMNLVCGYQAEYIQHFLIKQGFYEIVPLKDYINTDHCQSFDISKKEDVVLYNPRKGFEFTQQLMELAPDIQWIPLRGFTRGQLKDVMQKAKLYVDFGNHPGKDRLPRECAMNGCCVITGMRGSAGFFEDVPLFSMYKFKDNSTSVYDIIANIRYVLAHYDEAICDFQFYRNQILREKEEFEDQIKHIFQLDMVDV